MNTVTFPTSSFGEALKKARKSKRLTQKQLAQRLGVHYNTISAWELGSYLPETRGLVLELAHHLDLDEPEIRQLLEASLTALSPYWNIPYQRNPFFTGRDDILHQLHATLHNELTASLNQSSALSGLGGIGKTQTAIEYAYRYANEYSAVFWVGAQTYESLISSFVALADLLNLSEKQEQDQKRIVAAVIRWLNSHNQWLLIFDNVEDIALVKGFLPAARHGSLLFTSRRQALGLTAQVLDLKPMMPEEGIHFLLYRARLLDTSASQTHLAPSDKETAREIVSAMDGLPLALDQAGSYIETTRCSLSDYLRLFRSSPKRMLDEREVHADHPLSVVRTFALAFERLGQRSPRATELLTVCAFLAPEAIPETFFSDGAEHLGLTFEVLAADPFAFHEAITALLTYSLLQHNAVIHTVTIHRLMQAALKGSLSKATQRIWMTRIVCAMSHLFPSDETQVNYWQNCERLLPHALECITLSEPWDADEAVCVTSLMNHVAIYLSNRARYTEAEPLFQRALRSGEGALEPEHPIIAEVLNGLGSFYFDQGKYEQARPLCERALSIGERTLGAEHPFIAVSLNVLAEVYREQGKYKEADPLYQRALHIREQAFGSEHPSVGYPLINLALLYWQQGRYEEAEPLFLRALHIGEDTLGSEHPLVGHSLNGLAILYWQQGRYEEAEPLYLRALRIREQAFGPEHPWVAYPLNNLAELYRKQGRYEEAEPLYLRALHIGEQALEPEHPMAAYPFNNLAELYREWGRYEEAEPLYQRALHIWEQGLGLEHPLVAEPLTGLAELYRKQGRYEEAEPLYLLALHIKEQGLGLEHPLVAEPLTGLAELYRELGRYEEAEPLYQRALALRQQHLGPHHPDVAESLHHLARFRQMQQQTTEALSLYQQALAIRKKILGPQHSLTRTTHNAYLQLLQELRQNEE